MSDLANITAVILAGGLGTRLRGVVSDRPKVMAEINCRPFLSYLLDQLAKAGIARVVVCTGYMAAYIEEHIGSKHKRACWWTTHERRPHLVQEVR